MEVRPLVALRPARVEDEPFLYRLYASTRAEELAPLGWDEAAATAFLRMQFDAQARSYHRAHPGAEFSLVLVDGHPAGRLYVERTVAEIRVIDIALLPEHRGQGIGAALLRELLEEGRGEGKPVRLSALRTSPALALYDRLGFTVAGGDEVYLELECGAEPPAPRPDQANTAS